MMNRTRRTSKRAVTAFTVTRADREIRVMLLTTAALFTLALWAFNTIG